MFPVNMNDVLSDAVWLSLTTVMPVLLVAMLVGLVIGILQTATSIQEQTITFVPKIAAILLALVFFGPWMFATLGQYTIQLFQQIPQMNR